LATIHCITLVTKGIHEITWAFLSKSLDFVGLVWAFGSCKDWLHQKCLETVDHVFKEML